MCVCMMMVLAQWDLVAVNIRGWTWVHSSIILRWITIALFMLSISFFMLLYYTNLRLLLRIHIHVNACFIHRLFVSLTALFVHIHCIGISLSRQPQMLVDSYICSHLLYFITCLTYSMLLQTKFHGQSSVNFVWGVGSEERFWFC